MKPEKLNSEIALVLDKLFAGLAPATNTLGNTVKSTVS